MCDEEHRDPAAELIDGAGELLRGIDVKIAGRLIEDQDRGRLSNARAIAMRCFCPPESPAPCSPIGVCSPAAALDRFVDLRRLAGMDDVVERRMRVGEHDVVVDRPENSTVSCGTTPK